MEQDNTSNALLLAAEPQLTIISLATVVTEINMYESAKADGILCFINLI